MNERIIIKLNEIVYYNNAVYTKTLKSDIKKKNIFYSIKQHPSSSLTDVYSIFTTSSTFTKHLE